MSASAVTLVLVTADTHQTCLLNVFYNQLSGNSSLFRIL